MLALEECLHVVYFFRTISLSMLFKLHIFYVFPVIFFFSLIFTFSMSLKKCPACTRRLGQT